LDWLEWEFEYETSTDGMSQPDPLENTMYEIQDYIWDAICKETGNYQKMADPEMVNKQEFIENVRFWLENHTYDDKYWTSEGDDLCLDYLIVDICKYLEK
jgi:hypothetical protein